MKDIATGDITSVMASHAIGNGDNISILICQFYSCGECIISNEMASHEYHVFILMSHTTNPTGCRYIYCYHYII